MQRSASCARLASSVLIQHRLNHVLQGIILVLDGFSVCLAKEDFDAKKDQQQTAHLKMCALKEDGVMGGLCSLAHQELITLTMALNPRKLVWLAH